jgi:4-hydroxymandelate oxidase
MMSPRFDGATTRRRFLQYLAASPLFDGTRAFAQNTPVTTRLPDPMVWGPHELDNLISDPKEALDVFDFEPVAKRNVPPAHFGYMVTGIDDEMTLRANREGFLKFHLNPRRLVDVSAVDMTTEIFRIAASGFRDRGCARSAGRVPHRRDWHDTGEPDH